jgi:hypothetical protein
MKLPDLLNLRTGLSILLFSLSGLAAIAQTDSTVLHACSPGEERLGIKTSSQKTDTVLDNLHNYYETGVLGNMGLPSFPLLVRPDNAFRGFFRWMPLNNSRDLFTAQQSVYFYPQGKVYTRLFGAMGQKQEQFFRLLHSQNIRRINVTLAFNRYSCIGFYARQRSIADNLLFSSHANTKSGRAGYNFYVLYNKLKYELNGGIDTSRVRFADNLLVEKKLFPVLLSSARQNLRTAEINFKTFLRLNKDSAGMAHLLAYEVNYQGNYWLNIDGVNDSARYTDNYYYALDGVNEDSISFRRLTNSLYYKLSLARTRPGRSEVYTLYAGYSHELGQYHQFVIDTTVTNHALIYGLNMSSSAGSRLGMQGAYALQGYNAGNWHYHFDLRTAQHASFYGHITFDLSKHMPDYMSISYFSPHFIWSDTFHDILEQSGRIMVASDKYRFSLGVIPRNQTDAVYFDTLALPRQYNGSSAVTAFFIRKDLKLGPVHFNNTIQYQKVATPGIIRLPEYYTMHQLYYEGRLFKKALWLQAGVQARYVSAFRANAYMPATNQFYLQNEQEYGNYVFVDVFINAQIDRFRFFLLGSHLNQGLSGANYMLAPNYPMPDRSLKAGLCWMFFD